MAIVSTAKMTARQFLELGEDPPGVRLELVDGEVAVSPSPIPDHSYVDKALSALLFMHVKSRRLGRLYGDVDTIFGEYDIRRPDLIFFAKERIHLVGEKAMEGPPDLCVEIISPSSGTIDRRDKFKQYADGGVVHYWIVDPRMRTIEGFKLSRGKYRPTGSGKNDDVVRLPPFQDLEIPLGELWQPRD
ncbi:MAG: Uma2 family endonuclease [Anaerolineae bacterium]|nr:Uma2 family endonuclease [Phycisphaerae bacterium]